MIEIFNNKEKNITFEVDISGANVSDLNGFLRLEIDGIEYGFKANIHENTININIPPLKNIIHKQLRQGEKIKSKLEIYGDEYYLVPWKGDISLKNPVVIEAKIVEDSNEKVSSKKPKISIIEETDKNKTVSNNTKKLPLHDIQEKKKLPKDIEVTKDHIYRFMEKNGTLDKRIQNIILEKCTNKVGDSNLRLLLKEIIRFYKIKKIKNNLRS